MLRLFFGGITADVMDAALAAVDIRSPVLPLISNVTAEEVSEPAEIRTLLVRQVTGMVRWRESVLCMKSRGVRELVEIGTGKVLSGLARRIDRELSGISIGTPADIEALVRSGAIDLIVVDSVKLIGNAA